MKLYTVRQHMHFMIFLLFSLRHELIPLCFNVFIDPPFKKQIKQLSFPRIFFKWKNLSFTTEFIALIGSDTADSISGKFSCLCIIIRKRLQT